MTFGDAAQPIGVGNLDNAFGHFFWPATDLIFPLASVAVFLLYGKSKGVLHLRRANIMLFIAFLGAIIMIQLDDIFKIFDFSIILPIIYYPVARWVYAFTAITTFLALGYP